MSRAVCVKCGNFKDHTFALCARCGFDPAAFESDKEIQAKSLLLSEQYASKKELARASADLQAGRAVQFDTGKVSNLISQLATQKISIGHGPPAAVAVAWLPWALAALVAVGIFSALAYASLTQR